MQTVADGQMWLSYSQAYLTSGGEEHPQLDVCFPGQSNGLLGAALPGCLYLVTGLHTGEVPITVEVHTTRPAVDDSWEEVVEASFRPDDERVTLLGCMGDEAHEFGLDVVPYRVRYCASGMDEGHSADTRSDDEQELDRYLLQFWPAPPEPDAVLRQASEIAAYWHGVARKQPSAEEFTARRRAQAAAAAQERADREDRYAAAVREQRDRATWGGPRPADPLGSVVGAAPVAQVDLALAQQLVRLPPEQLRPTARWAARAALVEAGLDGIDWIAAALEALEAGADLPAPFGEPGVPINRLFADPRVPRTTVTTPDGRTDNLSKQAMGLCTLVFAADPDPVRALFVAVQHTQLAFGRDRLDVLHGALREYLQELR